MEQMKNGPKTSSFVENEKLYEECKDSLLMEGKNGCEEKTLRSNRGSAMKRTSLPYTKKAQPEQENEVEKSGLFMRV